MKNITPKNISSWNNFLILDVRQLWEWDLCNIPGSQIIPLDQLAERYLEISQDKPIITLCQHGVRSIRAAFFLEQQGFEQVYNLEGGLSQWAHEILSSCTSDKQNKGFLSEETV